MNSTGFLLIKNIIYDPLKFECSEVITELESREYDGLSFKINNFFVKFRTAKITPTKAGQFVTCYKRVKGASIQPFDVSDDIDFLVINTRKNNYFGQFIFPKSVLLLHDVLSTNGEGGKRALRVYPPWDENLNMQAQKTQKWQLEFFLDISENKIDFEHAKKLYSNIS